MQLEIRVNVLYFFSDPLEYQPLYEMVQDEFNQVNHIFEEETQNQILGIFHSKPSSDLSNHFFMFMVDDMLFFREVNLTEILFRLQSDHQLYAAHLKLYPGINYSHTNNKIIGSLPKFQVIDQTTMRYLKFRRSETEMDWNYPFDFCGSIYQLKSVIDVIEAIEDKSMIIKPNTFEYHGNVAVKKKMLAKDKPYCLCLNSPVMTVITVNKVQDIYHNPVYKLEIYEEEKKTSDKNDDVLQLINKCLISRKDYAVDEFYAKTFFPSVHIGDFRLKQAATEGREKDDVIAVVMAVYNSHEYLADAIKSILSQTYSNIRLLVINDGSTEPKVAQVIKQFEDKRIMCYEFEKNQGLASALNFGIGEALKIPKVKYIARMDSDDISQPLRLQRQYEYLEVNDEIDICGCGVFLFGVKRELKVIIYPSQHELIEFDMIFYCALAHPTLMIRASKASTLKYENCKMEDYKLWLSELSHLRFSNIGSVLFKLRKHEKNKSASHTLQDEAEFKAPYLINLLREDAICSKIRENPLIVEEFIMITGREVKTQEVFKQLKHRQELVQIFDAMTKCYQNREDISSIYKERILKNLSDRKGELAAFAVATDLDTEMLKCLLAGGQLKKLMKQKPSL